MSLKRFNADLRSARRRLEVTGISGIVALERGDKDGELVVTYIHNKLPMPVLIRLVSVNPDSYPEGNNFLLFADAQNTHPTVTSALENLQNFTFGQTIFESLRDVSTGVTSALNQSTIKLDGDTDMDGTVDDDDASDNGYHEEELSFREDDGDDDFVFGLAPQLDQKPNALHLGDMMAPGVLNKIRRDLRKAREAGAKIGILSGVHEGARNHMFSLSIRARKLGISDEALEAWDIDSSDYIVLLCRVDEPYPSVENLLEKATASFHAEFRFGRCNRSKPSRDSARRAFEAQCHGDMAEQSAETQNKQDTSDINADSHAFTKLFISTSMEQFMNEHFLSLAKLRLTGCRSWDDANSQLLDLFVRHQTQNGIGRASGVVNAKGKGKTEEMVKDVARESVQSSFVDAHEQQTLPTILTWDPFADSSQDISMPLIAMQFALHYFVRCTEYCLRCHRKVKKEFEALKPYVCEDPLCLFQYITMGFGPSIEHEILSQPYVVDLLVTLCYSSIQDQSLVSHPMARGHSTGFPIRDFPAGLRLKVASLPPSLPLPLPPSPYQQAGGLQPSTKAKSKAGDNAELYSTPIKVLMDFESHTFSVEDPVDLQQLTRMSWVVLRHLLPDGTGKTLPGQMLDPVSGQMLVRQGTDHVLFHQAYLKTIDFVANRVDFDMKIQDPALFALVQPGTGPQTVELYRYDFEFDELDNAGKARAMSAILATLPPISHLREYLIKHPHSRLRSYHGISPSAATLLEWIVASNRSFILQVNHVNDFHAQDKGLLSTIKTRDQEVIPSLSQGYVQFRFAMGNPDKELRFQRALKESEAQAENKYPTLFAWHGSALQNWHSILRHGLDFKKVANGRAFGNGVYFSPQYVTSQGYMRSGAINWPNSALNPTGVIALCEIINSPDKFLSSDPHYVVQQLDWIQCRYLFIQSNSPGSYQLPPPGTQSVSTAIKLKSMDELPQDPSRKVLGPQGGHLQIPRKALPASRGGKPKKPERSLSKRSHHSLGVGGDTDEEDAADISALFSDNDSPQPPLKRVQPLAKTTRTASRDFSIDDTTARRVTTKRPLTPPKNSIAPSKTDFRPGTLDLNTIPRLALPDWADASSSKRLASDIKMMQNVQTTTPLHELGWYIDFSSIDNMFQWIVELHTFDPKLPLAKDMKKAGITSVVLEVRFGRDYPFSPPFIRVIRPKFLPFMEGGGGHVTIGGAICMEMLTSTGWTAATSMESVLVSVKMAMSSTDPQPARLQNLAGNMGDYSAYEALSAFQRFASRHGWKVPSDAAASATQQYDA